MLIYSLDGELEIMENQGKFDKTTTGISGIKYDFGVSLPAINK